MKSTSVPGPIHVVVQALLTMHIQSSCPSGAMVQVFTEYPLQIDNKTYRIDVLARYYWASPRSKKEVIYEVQYDLDLESFKLKMKCIERSGGGEILPLRHLPQEIRDAIQGLSDWVSKFVKIPDR